MHMLGLEGAMAAVGSGGGAGTAGAGTEHRRPVQDPRNPPQSFSTRDS